MIDLLLTNDDSLINFVNELDPFGKSDHMSFEFILNLNLFKKDSHVEQNYNYKKGNYEALNSYFLTIDWKHLFNNSKNLEDYTQHF